MRTVDLRRVDLNLLVVLDALLEERHVTRAAARLALSQPAASRALARLRALFADALLVDGPAGYQLSARAEALRPALRATLSGITGMLATTAFDPAAATGTIRLLTTDLHSALLGPPLLALIAAEAPRLGLDILPPGPAVMQALQDDSADVAAGVFDDAPAGMHRRALFEDRFVTLMRKGHPAAARGLTLERYLKLEHLVVSITGTGAAPVDQLLHTRGRSRRVKVRVPNFLAAVEIAASSDLVMTLPASLARTAAGARRFVTLPPPADPGPFTLSLLWHARHHDAPRHVWLRKILVRAAEAIKAGDEGPKSGARRA